MNKDFLPFHTAIYISLMLLIVRLAVGKRFGLIFGTNQWYLLLKHAKIIGLTNNS